jgi:hypothetical protein
VTVLLWGIPGEGPFDAVRAELRDLRAPVTLFDQRAAAEISMELEVGARVTGRLVGPGYSLDLSTVTAVYARAYDPTSVATVSAAGAGSMLWSHALSLHDAFRVWSELTPAFLVNRLNATATNNSKPYQASLLAGLGFRVPITLVTTDPATARAFVDLHGDVIYKSVSGIRSIVARVTGDHGDRLDRVARCPTQFQAYVEGTDVRVHVVGERVFATRIESRAVDYRYPKGDDVTLAPTEVPAEIAQRCRACTKGLGLVVAGIDLRVTAKGEWFAFEVNPSPAFAYYDHGGAIARAVAALLASGGKS